MYYEDFKKELKRIDKLKEDYCRRLCLDTWIGILNELDIEYKIIFNGFCIKLENNIYISLYLHNITEWQISYYNYAVSGEMFPYGEIFNRYSVEESLRNMIKIAEMLNQDKNEE